MVNDSDVFFFVFGAYKVFYSSLCCHALICFTYIQNSVDIQYFVGHLITPFKYVAFVVPLVLNYYAL